LYVVRPFGTIDNNSLVSGGDLRKKYAAAIRTLTLWLLLFLVLPALTMLAVGIVDVHDEYDASPDATMLSAWPIDFTCTIGTESRQSFWVDTLNHGLFNSGLKAFSGLAGSFLETRCTPCAGC